MQQILSFNLHTYQRQQNDSHCNDVGDDITPTPISKAVFKASKEADTVSVDPLKQQLNASIANIICHSQSHNEDDDAHSRDYIIHDIQEQLKSQLQEVVTGILISIVQHREINRDNETKESDDNSNDDINDDVIRGELKSWSNYTSSSIYHSATSMLELVSQFLCMDSDGTLLKSMLDFLNGTSNDVAFTTVDLECIRGVVVQFVGYCIRDLNKGSMRMNDNNSQNGTGDRGSREVQASKKKRISNEHSNNNMNMDTNVDADAAMNMEFKLPFLNGYKSHNKNSNYNNNHDHEEQMEQEFEWREEALMACKQILIPRLQDKAQSIRFLAIRSSSFLFDGGNGSNVSGNGNGKETDGNDYNQLFHDHDLTNPELHDETLSALMWNLTHDPSPLNRSAILRFIPITIETLPCIVERVRDAKLKVRMDALILLQNKHDTRTRDGTRNGTCITIQQLAMEQRQKIIRDCLSTRRYPQTYRECIKLVCGTWLKQVSGVFDPIVLLDCLDPVGNESFGVGGSGGGFNSIGGNEEVCELVARALISVATGSGSEGANTNAGDEMNMNMSTEVALTELSAPEIRAFKEAVLKPISIINNNRKITSATGDEIKDENVNDNDDEALSPASILFLRTKCEMILESKTLSEYKKSMKLAEIVPDVTVLGEVLGKHVAALKGVMEEKDHLSEDQDRDGDDDGMRESMLVGCDHREEREVFLCLQLLKLSKYVDLKEEGSRRHFASIMHRILEEEDTHEDLVEGAVHALKAAMNGDEGSFLLSISEVLGSIIEDDGDEGGNDDEHVTVTDTMNEDKIEQYLRAIEILSVALEQTSRKMSKNAILGNFNSIILQAITTPSLGPLVREAGVSCLGRYVILMEEGMVLESFKPLLMKIVAGEGEKVEIRAQALLALCDLAFMFHRIMAPISLTRDGEGVNGNAGQSDTGGEQVTLGDLLLQMISSTSASKKSLAIVAAECASKLLLTGKMHDANIVAHLVAMYFDKNIATDAEGEEAHGYNDDAVKEVGSPTRLAQLLTIFFPAYSMGSAIGRDTLTACFRPLLDIVQMKNSIKVKGRRAIVWPIAKMVEYLCQTIESGEDAAMQQEVRDSSDEIDNAKEADNEDKTPKDASPVLHAAIAICDYLSDENDNLSLTYLRALCKVLSKSYIDVESEDPKALLLLKRGLDDLAMNITDNAAMKSLEYLVDIVDEVDSDLEEDGERAEFSEEDDDGNDEDTVVAEKSVLEASMEDESMDAGDGNIEVDEEEEINHDLDANTTKSDVKKVQGVPTFAIMGGDMANSNSILATPKKISHVKRTSNNTNIPAFATVASSDLGCSARRVSTRKARSANTASLPLFASLGSNSGVVARNSSATGTSSVFESESESDASSSSYESDEYSD